METILIEIDNNERSKEIKAALKALNVKFVAIKGADESKRIAKSVSQGYKEMIDVRADKLEAKDARLLIKEL